jgi:uncharacterized membrane protein
MTWNRPLTNRRLCAGGTVVFALLLGCTDYPPTSPSDAHPVSEASGDTGPTVKSVVPSSSPRDTTIDVLIRGSGFSQGSRVVWALNGDTTFQATQVRTNSTTFLTARELIVNVTIEADATLALYDIEVLASGGKKGIGIEIFEVTNNITTLPSLGGSASFASALNETAIVVGSSTDERGEQHAVRWRRERSIWRIEKLPGGVHAGEINNRGTIAGINTALHLVLWPLRGGVIDLGPGIPLDISEEETVVGWVRVEGSEPIGTQAAVWTKRSSVTWSAAEILPGLAVGASAEAIAINDAGTKIVGHAWDAQGVEQAVRWDLRNGTWQAPAIIQNSAFSAVTEINNNGEFAGSGFACDFEDIGCTGQAMFWAATEARSVLNAFDGFTHTAALNDGGDVVGLAERFEPDFARFAFLWIPRTGTFEDIGMLLGDSFAEASDINNQRLVVGYSDGMRGAEFLTRAVLWTLRR